MRENTDASVEERVNPIRNSNQPDKYGALVEKLTQLEANNWPKFQEQLKNLHSGKIDQTEVQTNEKNSQ